LPYCSAIGPRTAALMELLRDEGYCSEELAAKDWVRFAELVTLPDQAHKNPEQLSVGKLQRVEIALALCMNP